MGVSKLLVGVIFQCLTKVGDAPIKITIHFQIQKNYEFIDMFL